MGKLGFESVGPTSNLLGAFSDGSDGRLWMTNGCMFPFNEFPFWESL